MPERAHRLPETPPRGSRRLARTGVTLIELMIVIIIIGVLAAIAYPTIYEQLKAQDSYDAARHITRIIKSQRYRARNLNRATGVLVSATNNDVRTYISTDNTCANIATGSPTVVLDVSDEYPEAVIVSDSNTANYVDKVICIKPNGKVLEQSSNSPFTSANSSDQGGGARFDVARADGIGNNHIITLPFNGIARLIQ